MRKSSIRIGTAISALCLLAGCIHIDEARVFQPQPVENKASSVEEMRVDWQEIFERPASFTFTNGTNNDHSTVEITEDDFIPATLDHGFWAGGTIAVTEVSTNTPDRPLVVHCGGNASDRYNSGTFFGLKTLPYADLIVFDYPGYGDSPGTPSATSFEHMIDGLAAELNEMRTQTGRPLVLWGYSLGGFVCAELLGAVDKVDAIIIESSAANAQGAARELVPALLRPFVRVKLSASLHAYDNVEAVRSYQGPVLVLAGADDGILPARLSRELAAGLDAKTGERGVKLSGGQRQRIAIARIFLKDAPILVLDEATSALDSEVEAAIQDHLFALMEGKTVMAIAHRLSTIAQMDRLIVLDDGKIIEQGTHEDLIGSNGLYAELWARQSGGFIATSDAVSPAAE